VISEKTASLACTCSWVCGLVQLKEYGWQIINHWISGSNNYQQLSIIIGPIIAFNKGLLGGVMLVGRK
jgi:hypothetical protein